MVIYVGNVLFGRIGHGGSRGNTWKRRGIIPLEDKLDFLGPWWPRDACKGLGIFSIYDGERRHLWGNSGSFSCSVSCASENDPSPRNGYSLSAECRFESREIQGGELFLSRRARSVKGAVCIKRFRDKVYFC